MSLQSIVYAESRVFVVWNFKGAILPRNNCGSRYDPLRYAGLGSGLKQLIILDVTYWAVFHYFGEL